MERPQFRAANTVALATSWTIALALYLAKQPLATFYGNEGVDEVLELLALNFLIMPLGTPLVSLFLRELQFGKVAMVSIAGTITQVSVTIIAAYLGESYLSMAWGSIAHHIVRVVILGFMRPADLFVLPGIHEIRGVLKFGVASGAANMVGALSGRLQH